MSATNAVAYAPVDRTAQRVSIIWGCVAVITCLLVALIVTAPIAQAAGHTALALSVYKTFSYLCHQIPERSFHLAGHKFAVCSRCTGLYSGFALATLIYPLTRSLKRTCLVRRAGTTIEYGPTGSRSVKNRVMVTCAS